MTEYSPIMKRLIQEAHEERVEKAGGATRQRMGRALMNAADGGNIGFSNGRLGTGVLANAAWRTGAELFASGKNAEMRRAKNAKLRADKNAISQRGKAYDHAQRRALRDYLRG